MARISVKKHHSKWLQQIMAQMEVDDPTEALNVIFFDLKRMGYSFNSPMTIIHNQEPRQDEPQQIKIESLDEFKAKYPDTYQEGSESFFRVNDDINQATDPLIQRLLNLGICDQQF